MARSERYRTRVHKDATKQTGQPSDNVELKAILDKQLSRVGGKLEELLKHDEQPSQTDISSLRKTAESHAQVVATFAAWRKEARPKRRSGGAIGTSP